jgi:transcriptional regulator with XRE-family HTH domain
MSDKPVGDSGRLPWLGPRLRAARLAQGIGLAELAAAAQISRSYLHELETADSAQRPVPTATVLLRLAQRLGTSIGELVEEHPRQLSEGESPAIPPGLLQAANEAGLGEGDVRQLARIRFRGEQPRSVERWKFLIQNLELSEKLDEPHRQ